MKPLKEALIKKHSSSTAKKLHRIYWDSDKSMYTDPEDIIAMFLSRKCIVHDQDGNYFIPFKEDAGKIEKYVKNKQYEKLANSTFFVPIDTFAYEQAQDILEEEEWKFERCSFVISNPIFTNGGSHRWSIGQYFAIFLKD